MMHQMMENQTQNNHNNSMGHDATIQDMAAIIFYTLEAVKEPERWIDFEERFDRYLNNYDMYYVIPLMPVVFDIYWYGNGTETESWWEAIYEIAYKRSEEEDWWYQVEAYD